MKNAVFWDIESQFVPHRTHYVSTTVPSRLMLYKIEVFTAVTMKNAVFYDIKTPFVLHRSYITSLLQGPAG
jgi:hypothetical protein